MIVCGILNIVKTFSLAFPTNNVLRTLKNWRQLLLEKMFSSKCNFWLGKVFIKKVINVCNCEVSDNAKLICQVSALQNAEKLVIQLAGSKFVIENVR